MNSDQHIFTPFKKVFYSKRYTRNVNEVCIYIKSISVYFDTQNNDFVPTESVSVFKKVCFVSFRSVSVIGESISVFIKVRFGLFRSALVRSISRDTCVGSIISYHFCESRS